MTPAATGIRPLRASDAEAFSALRRELCALHPVQMGISLEEELQRPIESFRSQLSMPVPNAVFGAFVDGELAATAAVSRSSAFLAAAHKMTMWAVFTSTRHRRRGLSRRLVEHAVAHAFANGIHRVNLTVYLPNDPALALYRSLGFVECGREPDAVQLGGRYYHGMQMTLCKAESADAAYEYP
ncbi:MAG: acetyltransferase [Ramlibacter sp.]|nr:acetyltransferase [Ramlibacter sp.]